MFRYEIGQGRPLVVLHGGPDFDHTYLRPELDRLAEHCRLVYYDQRGRGRSAAGIRADDVSIQSEIDDLDEIRMDLGVDQLALLGHSWGGLLAAEYAVRHRDRVSHLILLDTAPLSYSGYQRLSRNLAQVRDMTALTEVHASERYLRGDLDAEADFYRIHFRPTVNQPDLLEELVGRLRQHFTPETVLQARAIEHRLYRETFLQSEYNLLPALGNLNVPSLIIHGATDFVPVEIASEIAHALSKGRLIVLPGCGHFTFLEAPDFVAEHVGSFMSAN
jgi:proline iminopeptidase